MASDISWKDSEIGTTVTPQYGENKINVNFGWDHQFK
jgi:hypothetical protein